MSGAVSYHGGLAAEEAVARLYQTRGHLVLAKRYRSKAGEIDLVVEKDGIVVFVEVKKSRTTSRAAYALSERQMARIYASAALFLETRPDGQNSDARFDVALVNGQGTISVIENAIYA